MPDEGVTSQCPELLTWALRWLDQLPPGVALLILCLAAVAAWSMWQTRKDREAQANLAPALQEIHSALAVLLDRRGGGA